ncbi:hypothetical protein ACBY01_00860 [Sphingomonas sp. ac-8]|uniref:hypothetical protein n=1 Tax=Sphingomonas sp. ac-8 TaxID=3242977 RepID=UPI003A802DA7
MSEAPRKRWRWLTLAEVVGVAALVISALTLWNNVSLRKDGQVQRAEEDARKQAAADAEAHASRLVTLVGTPRNGGRRLELSDANHRIERIEIAFPPSLKVPGRSGVLDTTIDGDWIADPLLKLTDGGPDKIEGRLPIRIVSRYWDGDDQREDSAIYELVFATEGHMLSGRTLRLAGVALKQRRAGAKSDATLDSLWAAERRRLGVPFKK